MACLETFLIGHIISLAHDYWLHEFGITLQELPIVISKDRGRSLCQEFVLSHLLTVSSSSCISVNHNSLVGASLVTWAVVIGVFNRFSTFQGPLCRRTVQVQAQARSHRSVD